MVEYNKLHNNKARLCVNDLLIVVHRYIGIGR